MKLIIKNKFFNYYLPLFLTAVLVVVSVFIYQIFYKTQEVYAAPAFVRQMTGFSSSSQTTSVSTTTPLTAGDALVLVATSFNSGGVTSISSVSQTNVTWNLLKAQTSGSVDTEVWYALNIPSNASTTVVINWVANPTEIAAANVSEYSGIATSSAVDGTPVSASGNSGSPASGNYTSSNGSDLLIAATGFDNNIPVNSDPAGYTPLTFAQSSSDPDAVGVEGDYQVVSSPNTYSATWSISNGHWGAILGALKGTGGGGGGGSVSKAVNDRGGLKIRGKVKLR